jgi:hypothetical protein
MSGFKNPHRILILCGFFIFGWHNLPNSYPPIQPLLGEHEVSKTEIAVDRGCLETNPLGRFKCTYEEPSRERLTMEEIMVLDHKEFAMTKRGKRCISFFPVTPALPTRMYTT